MVERASLLPPCGRASCQIYGAGSNEKSISRLLPRAVAGCCPCGFRPRQRSYPALRCTACAVLPDPPQGRAARRAAPCGAIHSAWWLTHYPPSRPAHPRQNPPGQAPASVWEGWPRTSDANPSQREMVGGSGVVWEQKKKRPHLGGVQEHRCLSGADKAPGPS